MTNAVLFLLIFLLLLLIEGAYNYLAGLWAIFWIIPELIFDAIFFLAIMAIIFMQGDGRVREVRE